MMEINSGKQLIDQIADINDLPKYIQTARELSILGDYEKSIIKFKLIFQFIYSYSKKYDNVTESKQGGYAAQTASSKKKISSNNQVPEIGAQNGLSDMYHFEKWNDIKKQLKDEYDKVVNMHQTLQTLDENFNSQQLVELQEFYQVDSFVDKNKLKHLRNFSGKERPIKQIGAQNSIQKLEKHKSYNQEVKNQRGNSQNIQLQPIISKSAAPQQNLKFKNILQNQQNQQSLDQDAEGAQQAQDFLYPPKKQPNQRKQVAQSDIFSYNQIKQVQNKNEPQNDGVHNRFGGLLPFQHHQLQKMGVDVHQIMDNQNDDNEYDRNIPHQIFFKQPSQKTRDASLSQDKDPDVWDPPTGTPPNQQQKHLKKNIPQQWGKPQVNNNQAQKKPNLKNPYQKVITGQNVNVQPQQQKKNADAAAGNNGRRNYERPWLAPEKEKKQQPKTYLEHVYPEGFGPDAELINMIEQNVLVKNPQVNFDDIAELDETKKLLQEAVLLPILMPDYFRGIRRPWKGVCMFGPPGTGKTMLAKAVASQGQTTFFNVSAAGLASKWKGESEKLVRILFEVARFYAPSTIFFDEIDSLASQRGGSSEHEASRRVKSELLIQMDGVSTASSASANLENEEDQVKKIVMVLAATNRPQDLDEAIRRRLEKRVYIPLPSSKGREAIFKINLKGIKISDNIDFKVLVDKTEGYSGSDLANVCRDAAMEPMRRKLDSTGFNFEDFNEHQTDIDAPLTMEDFLTAISKNQKTVSQDQLQEFEDWMKEFGSS